MEQNESLFKDAPVSKAVFQMAIPTVISSLVLVIYNMADTFFVGQTHDAYQVAAVSLTNPVFVMYMAIANLLGIGGSALISILLGQQQKEKAKSASSFCCYASLGFGIVAGVLILIFLDPLLKILGSSENTWKFAKEYLFYIAVGAPVILFANSFSHAVRGEGAAKASMIGSMIGTVINIILDPVFILVLDMGTAGAAIATVLGNLFACLYYLYYFWKKSPLLSIHPKYFFSGLDVAKRLMSIGLPAGINSALMSVATILLNNALASYGDKPLAAMGIVTKAYMLIVFIHMGITNGIQPLLGYCYGAKNKKRFTSIMKFSGTLTVVCGTVLSAVYILCSRQIIGLFINDVEVIQYGTEMLRATSLAGPILGLLFLSINSMQAMDRPVPATLLSVCRQGLFFVPLLYLLKAAFGLHGVNYTQTVADYLTIVISLFLLRNSLKHFSNRTKKNVYSED
ncbi:MAG: MATE family efflux transporter [Lachnospiraceae bacterium]|nr:MATE family efflux transporter [Robinsoniella sp.]MDY3767571.1 MATE family efflux transporter [Lachnospiraceae bacterium]